MTHQVDFRKYVRVREPFGWPIWHRKLYCFQLLWTEITLSLQHFSVFFWNTSFILQMHSAIMYISAVLFPFLYITGALFQSNFNLAANFLERLNIKNELLLQISIYFVWKICELPNDGRMLPNEKMPRANVLVSAACEKQISRPRWSSKTPERMGDLVGILCYLVLLSCSIWTCVNVIAGENRRFSIMTSFLNIGYGPLWLIWAPSRWASLNVVRFLFYLFRQNTIRRRE